MRKLKHHERKLLKKVDFLEWKKESSVREIRILRRYHIQDREDYRQYNKMCGMFSKIAARLKKVRALLAICVYVVLLFEWLCPSCFDVFSVIHPTHFAFNSQNSCLKRRSTWD